MLKVPTTFENALSMFNEWSFLSNILLPDCAGNVVPPLAYLFDLESCALAFMVLQYSKESSQLAQYMVENQNHLEDNERSHIVKNIFEAVKAVHAHNYAHNNLNLGTILIDSITEMVQLLDFSEATKFASKPSSSSRKAVTSKFCVHEVNAL